MGYWTINGKKYNEAEYAEYKKQQLEAYNRAQEETRRLINVLGEAFTACDTFIEAHPSSPYGVKDDAQKREHEIYERLRRSLGSADRAPRCEKVREDGTRCGSPQMKGYRYCYAHERMLQHQSQKLELPALEDANGIQMAIMRVQKALIDDEISEKKAGLLLYSLQMASSNLKHTTFTSKDNKDVVTEMVEAPTSPSSKKQVLPLMDTDDTDRNKTLPRINADDRGSEEKLPEAKTQDSPLITSDDTGQNLSPQMNADKRRSGKSNAQPQPGAAVPHDHRVGSGL
jgi:hypothetical protein